MTRYGQYRKREDLTPFANLLADYIMRKGFYNLSDFAAYLGVHRNTLSTWFKKGYIPQRDTLMHIYSKLDDVPADEFWRAVGLEVPPRPREHAVAEQDEQAGSDDWQRELDRFEGEVWRIQNDPRLSAEGRQAMLDLLRVLRAGGRPVERRILAEHVVESEAAAHGANEPLHLPGSSASAPTSTQPQTQPQPQATPHPSLPESSGKQ